MGISGSNRRGGASGSARQPRGAPAGSSSQCCDNGNGAKHPSSSAGSVMQFEIPSDHKEGRQVERQILEAAQRCGFEGNNLFAIKLALEEAMINAIKHGNKLDPAKKVYIQAEVDSKRIKITIQDEGPGFRRKDVPDPTLDENLTKSSGRGILLMEAYMDSVKYTDRGRCVCMVKKNQGARGKVSS
jgi:serine/threonine-protein kinase RsbW